jgi:hypothetical protein
MEVHNFHSLVNSLNQIVRASCYDTGLQNTYELIPKNLQMA